MKEKLQEYALIDEINAATAASNDGQAESH